MQNHEFSILKVENMNIEIINQEHYIKIVRNKNIMKSKSQKDQDHQPRPSNWYQEDENYELST